MTYNGILMKVIFSIVTFLFLLPLPAQAVQVEEWKIETETELRDWSFSGINEGRATAEGFQFDVAEQATMFRPLPEDFHSSVDGIEIGYDAAELEEVSLLLLQFNDDNKITRRFKIGFLGDDGPATEYIPLDLHRSDIAGTEEIAIVYKGDAKGVIFDHIKFFRYNLFEEILGAWRSFWRMQSFQPFTINILHGPVVIRDIGPYHLAESQHVLARSVNAYLLVGLSVFGIALLFFGLYRIQGCGEQWNDVSRNLLAIFFGTLLAVWLLYDLRMGSEFIRNVANDHWNYINPPPLEKEFRDVGNFHEFAAGARKHLGGVAQYEFFTRDRWPFFGMMRYETYPAKPNPNEPSSDVWVIYNRSDMRVGNDGRLMLSGQAITKAGEVLWRFDSNSFIFRGKYASPPLSAGSGS